MELTQAQFNELQAAGLKATNHNLDGFAEACYDLNTYSDICGFQSTDPDEYDMREWEITADEWRNAQKQALEKAMFDFQADS